VTVAVLDGVRLGVLVTLAVGVRVNVRVVVAVRVIVGVKVMVGVRVIVGDKDGVGLGPSVLVVVAVGVTEAVAVIVEVGDRVGVWVALAVIVALREGVGVGAVSSCTTRDKSLADTRPSTLASAPGHELWPKMAATTASRSVCSMIPLQLASPTSTAATARVGCMQAPARATTNRRTARRDAAFLVGPLLVCICSSVALFRVVQ